LIDFRWQFSNMEEEVAQPEEAGYYKTRTDPEPDRGAHSLILLLHISWPWTNQFTYVGLRFFISKSGR
jgi:hypothetical protein